VRGSVAGRCAGIPDTVFRQEALPGTTGVMFSISGLPPPRSRLVKGQGALLNCQDVLFSTIEQVAMRRPFGLLRQTESPTLYFSPL